MIERPPSRDINTPHTWFAERDDHPKWLLDSNKWIQNKREPENLCPSGSEKRFLTDFNRFWERYVSDVKQLAPTTTNDSMPGLLVLPFGWHSDEASFRPESSAVPVLEGEGENGPFIMDHLRYPEKVPIPPDKMGIMPGYFWLGRRMYYEQVPLQAGVFVGFRRSRRPQLNPWWWEVVYAKLNGNGKLMLQAWNYNYLGMPLSALKNWSWRAKESDVIVSIFIDN